MCVCVIFIYYYLIFSKNVMERWSYPYVPDYFDSSYSYKQHNIYKHQEAQTERYEIDSLDIYLCYPYNCYISYE